MKLSRRTWIVIVIVGLLVLAAAALASWGNHGARIQRALDAAGSCRQDSDCTYITAPCPYGCWVGVRTDEKEKLQSLMSGYRSACVYDCAQALGASCVSGKCQVRTTDMDPSAPKRMSLTGTYGCLKPKDPAATNTEECQAGFTADGGASYGLDFMLMSALPPELTIGDRFSANGVVVPIERLSADHWRRFDAVGIFSVTDGVTKLTASATAS